jgi:hypothetical protein
VRENVTLYRYIFQVSEIKKMKIGNPLDRSVDHGPQNHRAHLEIKYIFTKFYRHISTNNEANRKFVILISNFSTSL